MCAWFTEASSNKGQPAQLAKKLDFSLCTCAYKDVQSMLNTYHVCSGLQVATEWQGKRYEVHQSSTVAVGRSCLITQLNDSPASCLINRRYINLSIDAQRLFCAGKCHRLVVYDIRSTFSHTSKDMWMGDHICNIFCHL